MHLVILKEADFFGVVNMMFKGVFVSSLRMTFLGMIILMFVMKLRKKYY